MSSTDTPEEMTAEAYLARLGERGIEYVFANAGTDFAPIVEGISRNAGNSKFPKFITVPHENVAMAMAHGYYRTCGKPAAVMVHVTVGTANTICGLMNAARDNVPILLAAGRTPITETGHIASRNRSIHWGQELFDQGGMVREFVKWDYELRAGQPVDAVVDRALDIAMSEPRGPVYLTLPREVLANPATHARRDTVRPLGVAAPEPARRVIEEAAAIIAKAEFPLIVTSTIGRDPEAVVELAKLADEFSIPVVQNEARDFNLPTDHPMHLGFEAGPWIKKADVVIVLDCVIPWIPKTGGPRRDAKIINISADPLTTRYPFKEIEADLLVQGDPCVALRLLREALGSTARSKNGAADTRPQVRCRGARGECCQAQEADRDREGPVAGPPRLSRALHQPAEAEGRHRGLRARRAAAGARHDGAALLHGQPALRRPRLRPRRRARRKTRRARARGDHHRRRRLLHVRQSPALSLCRPRREPADADHRRQQFDVGRGAAVDPRCLSGRPRRQGQRHAAHGAAALARLREGGRTCGGYGEKVETADAVVPALERALDKVRSGRRRRST